MTTGTFAVFLPVVDLANQGNVLYDHGHFYGFFARGQAKNIPTTGTFAVFLPVVRPRTYPPRALLRCFCPWCVFWSIPQATVLKSPTSIRCVQNITVAAAKEPGASAYQKSSRFFVVAAPIPIAGPTYCLSGIYNYI